MTTQPHRESPMTELALSVRDIHKSFGSVEVLKGISFEAHRGDVVSLIGQSGSGKSTLLRCINYLEAPDRGEITVSGETIRTVADKNGTQRVADNGQLKQKCNASRYGVPELRPLVAHDHPREHHRGAGRQVLGASRATRRSPRQRC